MNWNHRIVKEGDQYSICEVYYENEKVVSWTNPNEVTGDSVEDLEVYLEQMKEAFKYPIIEVDGDELLK